MNRQYRQRQQPQIQFTRQTWASKTIQNVLKLNEDRERSTQLVKTMVMATRPIFENELILWRSTTSSHQIQ